MEPSCELTYSRALANCFEAVTALRTKRVRREGLDELLTVRSKSERTRMLRRKASVQDLSATHRRPVLPLLIDQRVLRSNFAHHLSLLLVVRLNVLH